MPESTTDRELIETIGRLAEEGQDLYGGSMSDGDEARLAAIGAEQNRYWDLLRRRRALREYGRNPDRATLSISVADGPS
ncbi:MAG TPA: DUF2630 family protein [Gemmatimonadota bacterium]|nr:DUF2630 family protein [Gemmatimonadota bacterium]